MQPTNRVILIVIDGLRPDGMLRANTPNLDRLMARGVYSLQAQSVMPSITLPTHMSMFYGVAPEAHGVHSNVFTPNPAIQPGIVELVHQAGLNAAAFYSWEQLRDLWQHGAITYTAFHNIYSLPARDFDMEVARSAADYIAREKPDFAFVYLGMVDEVAHKVGWMSEGYFEVIHAADAAVGHLLERLEETGLLESTVILVQADHGGHDHGHGDAIPEDMTIPWLLSGPGVRRAGQLQRPVHITDTSPTIAHLLGLPAPSGWHGKAVSEALE